MKRYPLVTRALHWTLAALIFWQITIITAYKLTGGTPVLDRIASLGPSHGVVGLLVLPLALLRLAKHPVSDGYVAPRLVHSALRFLLVVIPALGLLRAYGSGKGWSHWGITIIPETGIERPWMVKAGDLAHGELAWAMTALILVHIAGALRHAIRRDGKFQRML